MAGPGPIGHGLDGPGYVGRGGANPGPQETMKQALGLPRWSQEIGTG